MNPNLDRFSDRWEKAVPLICFDCGEPLTETAETLYWDEHPHGEGEPRCLDCKSVLSISEMQPAHEPFPERESHLISTALFGCAVGCMIVGARHHDGQSGYYILAAIGCANLGLLVRITGH